MNKPTEEKYTGQNHELCFSEDSFLEDKTVWVAELSDGSTVYQDDHRPGIDEPIAWKRLRLHCQRGGLKINALRLKFRSHVETISDTDVDGYYFSYGLTKELSADSNQIDYYICGFFRDKLLCCKWYKVPEIIVTSEKQREVLEQDKNSESFIFN